MNINYDRQQQHIKHTNLQQHHRHQQHRSRIQKENIIFQLLLQHAKKKQLQQQKSSEKQKWRQSTV